MLREVSRDRSILVINARAIVINCVFEYHEGKRQIREKEVQAFDRHRRINAKKPRGENFIITTLLNYHSRYL